MPSQSDPKTDTLGPNMKCSLISTWKVIKQVFKVSQSYAESPCFLVLYNLCCCHVGEMNQFLLIYITNN